MVGQLLVIVRGPLGTSHIFHSFINNLGVIRVTMKSPLTHSGEAGRAAAGSSGQAGGHRPLIPQSCWRAGTVGTPPAVGPGGVSRGAKGMARGWGAVSPCPDPARPRGAGWAARPGAGDRGGARQRQRAGAGTESRCLAGQSRGRRTRTEAGRSGAARGRALAGLSLPPRPAPGPVPLPLPPP